MDEKKRYYNLITDIWQFMKSSLPAQNTDEYWREANNKATQLSNKHGDTKFAQSMILAVLDELERRSMQ